MKKLIVIHASKSQDDYKLSIEDIVEMNSQKRFLCGSITFRVDDFARNHKALKERHKLAQYKVFLWIVNCSLIQHAGVERQVF